MCWQTSPGSFLQVIFQVLCFQRLRVNLVSATSCANPFLKTTSQMLFPNLSSTTYFENHARMTCAKPRSNISRNIISCFGSASKASKGPHSKCKDSMTRERHFSAFDRCWHDACSFTSFGQQLRALKCFSQPSCGLSVSCGRSKGSSQMAGLTQPGTSGAEG